MTIRISSDVEAWDALRGGDRSALQQIYRSEIQYLYHYGCKLIQDKARTQDAIHDLFVELWDRRERLGSTDHIRKYLTVALRRKLTQVVKRDRRIEGDMEKEEVCFDPELSVESIMINKECIDEQSEKLKKAYKSLTNRQREVLYMKYYQGMEYEQIAEIVGIRYQSLRNVVSSAIQGLKVALVSLTVLVCIVSCSEDMDGEPLMDEALLPWIERFETEALTRGVHISIVEQGIGAVLAPTTEAAAGQCVVNDQSGLFIRIDPQYWSRASDLQKEFVVFHELGHCALGRAHQDLRDGSGYCISMMTSGLGPCTIHYSQATREQYIDELFSN